MTFLLSFIHQAMAVSALQLAALGSAQRVHRADWHHGAFASAGPKLVDVPIGADAIAFLDSSAGQKWTALSSGGAPAGCAFERTREEEALHGLLRIAKTPDICCDHCWAESLCTHATFTDEGNCWLSTGHKGGVTTVEPHRIGRRKLLGPRACGSAPRRAGARRWPPLVHAEAEYLWRRR